MVPDNVTVDMFPCCACRRLPEKSGQPFALYHPHDEYYEGDDQQNVDQAAYWVDYKPEQPKHQQHDDDCPNHVGFLWGMHCDSTSLFQDVEQIKHERRLIRVREIKLHLQLSGPALRDLMLNNCCLRRVQVCLVIRVAIVGALL